MAVVPHMLAEDTVESLVNNLFGLRLDPGNLQETQLKRRRLMRYRTGYVRPWVEATSRHEIFFDDAGSVVRSNKGAYQLILDIQQFVRSRNITVKIISRNTFTVEGEYVENEGTHGTVYRQMTRRYVVSSECDMATFRAAITTDRVLIVNIEKPLEMLETRVTPRIVEPVLLLGVVRPQLNDELRPREDEESDAP